MKRFFVIFISLTSNCVFIHHYWQFTKSLNSIVRNCSYLDAASQLWQSTDDAKSKVVLFSSITNDTT